MPPTRGRVGNSRTNSASIEPECLSGGSDGAPAAGIVLYQDALPIPAVDVAGDEVQLVTHRSEVAHPGQRTIPAEGVYYPEALYLRQPVAGLEEALDAFELDEDGAAVGGDGEAQAEQERAVGAERRVLEVEGQVVVAYEVLPLLLLLRAAFNRPLDERFVGLGAERDEVETFGL